MKRVARLVWRLVHRHAWSPWVVDEAGAWRVCTTCLHLEQQ